MQEQDGELLVIVRRVLPTAMPIVPPRSCAVIEMPPTWPCFSGGTAFMTAVLGGANSNVTPIPQTIRPGTMRP